MCAQGAVPRARTVYTQHDRYSNDHIEVIQPSTLRSCIERQQGGARSWSACAQRKVHKEESRGRSQRARP